MSTPTPADLAETLLRREREARIERERRARILRAEVSLFARQARATGRIRSAWLIGSLAWGEHGAGSDVDVVVEGLAPEDLGLLWGELTERLGCKVDLLRIEDLVPSFADRVRSEGVVLG
jgi:predicted nucleotidyltransferase